MSADHPQTAGISWREGGIPVSDRFDDPYFSLSGGLAETQHVFLAGNGLPARFRAGFQIAELGFGTGLNMLASWQAWRNSGQTGALRFTSFEAFPMSAKDMATALASFPHIAELAKAFLPFWQAGDTRITLPGLEVEVILGDANQTLPTWTGTVDAWFLDGFSPAKNPELWQPGLLAQVAAHTRPCGTFATYSAAGHIRQSLASVGFTVDRIPGFGRKRHMTTGVLKEQP